MTVSLLAKRRTTRSLRFKEDIDRNPISLLKNYEIFKCISNLSERFCVIGPT